MSDKRIRSHKSCTLLEMAIQFIMDFFIYPCSFVHISYLYYVHSSKYIIDLLHPLADTHKESRSYHSDLAKAVGLLYYFFVCICYRQQFIAGIYLMMSMDTIISPGKKGTLYAYDHLLRHSSLKHISSFFLSCVPPPIRCALLPVQ